MERLLEVDHSNTPLPFPANTPNTRTKTCPSTTALLCSPKPITPFFLLQKCEKTIFTAEIVTQWDLSVGRPFLL